MARSWTFALLLATVGPATGTACDRFFEIDGRVVSCADDKPIGGASVQASLVTGQPRTGHAQTDVSGRFSVGIHAPSASRARVDVSSPGFLAASRTFDGRPGEPVTLCLQPQR